MTSNDAQLPSFEDAFRQLAEISEGMEKGGLTLAEATERYEQGMKLVQHCNHLLDTAELEITQLLVNYQRPEAPPPANADSGPPIDFSPEEDEYFEDNDSLPF